MFGFVKRIFGENERQKADSQSSGDRQASVTWDNPWDEEQTALYAFVCGCVERGDESSPDLPDEERFNADSRIRWVAGAMDNLVGGDEGEELNVRVENVHAALSKAAETMESEDIRVFYETLIAGRTISYIDALIPDLVKDASVNAFNVLRLARWLVVNAPDREAVKFGIAIWGLGKGEEERDVFLTLACHEEFTVYAMVALSYLVPDEEHDALWLKMARRVHGWGRIRLVERLCSTEDGNIRDWLLREGYKNSVMYEYLAYACAVGGDLVEALRAPVLDAELLSGAAEIIDALLARGPARDIGDYADGAEVVRLFLGHVTFSSQPSLECFLATRRIESFLADATVDWKAMPGGWNKTFRHKIAEMAARITAKNDWKPMIEAGLDSEEETLFWKASAAAELLDIDTWSARMAYLKRKKQGQWYLVSQTDDPRRMDAVIDLACEVLEPLCEDGAFGPNTEMNDVVRALGRFPGKGWPLIQRSLQSPVERRRMGAVQTLAQWNRDSWSDETRRTLEAAMFQEHDEDVRDLMYNALLGRSLDLE